MELDKIFEKSDISEEKKKSKKYLGRLLLRLKKDNCIKLYSLMGSVMDSDISDNKLILKLSDKTSFDMISGSDKDLMKSIIKEFDSELGLEINCDEKNVFDMHSFENFLKDEFGKLLTIK